MGTWTNLFKGNRLATNGMTLSYIPLQLIDGQPVVQLEESKVAPKEEKWRCALIAYIIGETPGYNPICRYIDQNWSKVATPNVYYHEEGYCVLKFQSITNMHAIFYDGPYTINNRPIILKP